MDKVARAKLTPAEMLEIVNNWIPCKEGFRDPDVGEIITDDVMLDIQGDLDKAIDRIGMNVLEAQVRMESKKVLADHYKEEAKHEENRMERLKFYLGYLTQGKKKKCEHVTISFIGKQERLALRCKESQVPMEYKKQRISYEPDNTKIREALETIRNAKEGEKIPQDVLDVLEFAYIDTRKKASVK